MPVEMIGWIAPRVSSEIIPPAGPPFDAAIVAETARIHERAGFDRVLIGYFSDAPDGFLIGAHAASVTTRLGFLLAHRPGFVAPRRSPPASWQRSITSPAAVSRCTSFPAAATPTRPRTATGPTPRPAIAAPANISAFSAAAEPSPSRSTTRASSIARAGPIARYAAVRSRTSRFLRRRRFRTRRSVRSRRTSMSTCCGASR